MRIDIAITGQVPDENGFFEDTIDLIKEKIRNTLLLTDEHTRGSIVQSSNAEADVDKENYVWTLSMDFDD